MKKPNLYILGAPKCGTTSLFEWLRQHPEVFVPYIKEPYRFYSPYGSPMSHKEYESLYAEVSPDIRIVCEASTCNLFGGVAGQIRAYEPRARFIVCLRRPIEMVPSFHWQNLLAGQERTADLSAAWRLSDRRSSGQRDGLTLSKKCGDPRYFSYKDACSLGVQVERLLRQVPAARVYFIFLEDMKNDANSVFTALCDWLDIQQSCSIKFIVSNQAKRRRSKVASKFLNLLGNAKHVVGIKRPTGILSPFHQLNIVKMRYPEPSVELRSELCKHFSNDISLLEGLTARDLSHWQCR